jgi:hypothetical protein
MGIGSIAIYPCDLTASPGVTPTPIFRRLGTRRLGTVLSTISSIV